ncbi:MAG: hypothetical protein OQL20_12030 [Sedimenticola sp.]|nr:hypothetical protein [Sedimenticola sp.]
MKKKLLTTAIAIGLTAGLLNSAQAALVTDVVFKLGVNSTVKLDAYTGWTTAGSFGVAGDSHVTDSTKDYRSTLIDTWPNTMTSVRVSMFKQGVEQAFIDFDPSGTSSTNFFTTGNVTGSSWTDITSAPHNFFSIAGDDFYDRHWFVNRNYGGCSVDVGHMVVIDSDGSQPCGWETNRLVNDRAFLYSTTAINENWNQTNGDIGLADVFAVSITRNVPDTGTVPVPAPLALIGLGLLGLGIRRKTKQ